MLSQLLLSLSLNNRTHMSTLSMQLDAQTVLLDMTPTSTRRHRSYSVDSSTSSLPDLVETNAIDDPWTFTPPTIPAAINPDSNPLDVTPEELAGYIQEIYDYMDTLSDEEKIPLLRLDLDSTTPSSPNWTPPTRRPHPTELQPHIPAPSQSIPPLTLPNSSEGDLSSHIPLMVESLSSYPLSSAFAACFEEQLARLNEQCLDPDGVLRWDEKITEEVVTLENAVDKLRRIVPVGR